MRNNCHIDDVNVWDKFGVWVTKGGYNGLLSFPALVQPAKNEWPEQDGIEVDLENPLLQPKEVTITFLASKPEIHVGEFIEFISAPGYHTVHVPILKRSWRLRLVTQTAHKVYHNAVEFSLRFSEDLPTKPVSMVSEPGVPITQGPYELDGVPFSEYGIIVDVGRDALLKSPTIKQNLTCKYSTSDGQIYDVDQVFYSSKETTFKCRFKAASIERFWSCFDAFFHALVQPGERSLYVDYTGEEYPCYYKQSSAFKVIKLKDSVMIEFNLTLVFTIFRMAGVDYLLSSERGELVVSQDGEYFIDMEVYDAD